MGQYLLMEMGVFMSENILSTRIKNKIDTSINWEKNNPILLAGEIVVVKTNDGKIRFKVGDGEKKYNQLPFSDEYIYAAVSNKQDKKSGYGLSKAEEYDLLGDTCYTIFIDDGTEKSNTGDIKILPEPIITQKLTSLDNKLQKIDLSIEQICNILNVNLEKGLLNYTSIENFIMT